MEKIFKSRPENFKQRDIEILRTILNGTSVKAAAAAFRVSRSVADRAALALIGVMAYGKGLPVPTHDFAQILIVRKYKELWLERLALLEKEWINFPQQE